ncbi:Nif3-like dinuclear metal center hexameric protein [Jatrophihabitans sp. YIM 134969]
MTSTPPLTVGEVVTELETHLPPRWAESWDSVGLAVGDPAAPVSAVVLAVDPVAPVVVEAVERGAGLVVTHHPLLLSGVTSVARTGGKGDVVHDAIRAGVALFNAHTNADVAPDGVNQALADVLGLRDTRPLLPATDPVLDQLTVYVPRTDADALFEALTAAGAGRLGRYDRAGFRSDGLGTFRPLAGAAPAVGAVGVQETVEETRLELAVPRAVRAEVVRALRAAHPYEEPAFAVVEQVGEPGRRGLGRVGRLPTPTTLAGFVDLVASTLPATSWGVRGAGDPDRAVETVALCGGSGASEIDVARAAGADVYLTADLKHHVTSEATTEVGPGAMALVDAAHWATEWPWLPVLAEQMRVWFGGRLDVHVSTIVTDPWTVHRPSPTAVEART